jgi:predicted permease
MRSKQTDRNGDDTLPAEPAWRRYLRFFRANPAADLDDELHDHLESAIEALTAQGMSPDAARAEAMRRFGDVGRVRTEVQRMDARHFTRINRRGTIESVIYDIRYALRGLRRSPSFTLVAALSIALGVAANTAIFSIVNAVLLRPIPGTHTEGLVRVYANHHSPFAWDELKWFRDHAKSLDYIVGERYTAASFRAAPADDAERIHASYVTRGFFPALGVRVSLGHAFDIDEANDAGTNAVAVISHAFWQRRFAGDSAIVGRIITVSEHQVTVVGVAAPEFRSSVMSWVPDVFLPLAIAPVLTGEPLSDFGGSFYATARLRRGIGMGAAEAELRGLMGQLARTDKDRYEGMTIRLDHTRGVNAEERDGVAAGSVFLMAMVAMVLLIACANVANLLLGRAAARRTELGVRLAIGASRGRLMRQLLTESVILAGTGSAIGFAAAWFVTRAVPAALPPEAGIDRTYFEPDGTVVAYTAVLCLITAFLFGMVPAARAASPNLVTLLKGDGATGKRRRRGRFVIVQAALCVVLLAVASLFLRSLTTSAGVDPGFRPEGIVDVSIDLNLLGPNTDKPRAFEQLLRDASNLPSVQSATLAAVVPLSGSNMETRITPVGMTLRSRHDAPAVYFNIVAPGYFATLSTPILRGREFLESDTKTAPRVAVINATAARRLWPNDEAIGKRFHWGDTTGTAFEIVGVVQDANYVMPGERAKPTIYMPLNQAERGDVTLMMRTTTGVQPMRRAVWALLHSTVPTLPPPPVVRMTDDMAITLLPVRAGAALLGSFGALALILAATGIYGVAAYSVASRTREIGIRGALGATRARLMRMVLWESGRLVTIGAAIGLALSIAIAAGLSRVLYGVRAVDPLVLVTVAATIAGVAVLASLAPARRAANADPVASIRAE